MYKAQATATGTDMSLLQTGRFVANKTHVIRHETLKIDSNLNRVSKEKRAVISKCAGFEVLRYMY